MHTIHHQPNQRQNPLQQNLLPPTTQIKRKLRIRTKFTLTRGGFLVLFPRGIMNCGMWDIDCGYWSEIFDFALLDGACRCCLKSRSRD